MRTLLTTALCCCALGAPAVASSRRRAPADPVAAAQGLITRLLGPAYVPAFQLQVIAADPATSHDVFELDASGSTVVIRGNKGLSLAAGLGWYLKYSCNASWTWGRNGTGNQLGTVPRPGALPLPAAQRRVSPVAFRYAYNVCTLGYTSAWWGEQQWMDEIDRLALWGVNLPLAFVGQEKVWLDLYTSLGLSAADVQAGFFTGPAFLPWGRMGNIQSWGGPLDADWINASYALGTAILARYADYDMTPVLPGFAGHVPSALTALYPNASFTHSQSWNGFNTTYSSTVLLQPQDPLYQTIGRAFYTKLMAAFDVDPALVALNADTFNEMDPSSADPAYLRDSNAAIWAAMSAVIPNAVYVMQGWLFVNSPNFWTPAATQAYLSGVPDDRMLILDLFTESIPTWSRFQSYYGKPWVWNQLLVFGGRRSIYGNLTRLATGPVEDRAAPGSTMAGIGITPEAVEMVHIAFDLLLEMGWRADSPDLDAWISAWVTRRYGVYSPSLVAAWLTLKTTSFNEYYDYGKTTQFCWLQDAPQLTFSDAGDRITQPDGATAALRLFLTAAVRGEVNASAPTFRYDLIDVARQVVCNVFSDAATLSGAEFLRYMQNGVNTTPAVRATTAQLGGLIADLDALLGTDVNFLLGGWLADARRTGGNPAEADAREFNARNQISLWGPKGEINDYAAKNGWAGLVGRYYGSRWALHSATLVRAVTTGTPVDWTAYEAALFQLSATWGTNVSDVYPVTPQGDALAAASRIAARYITPGGGGGDGSNYTVLTGSDAVPVTPGVPVDLMRAWNRDVGVLQRLCDADPGCAGFNTNGFIKNSTAKIVQGEPCDLYVKAAAAR